jgi:hypothetical protein
MESGKLSAQDQDRLITALTDRIAAVSDENEQLQAALATTVGVIDCGSRATRIYECSKEKIAGVLRGTIQFPLHAVAKESSVAKTCQAIVDAFPELPFRIELAATGGVRNALESGEMTHQHWLEIGQELKKSVSARGGGCVVNTRILKGEEEAAYEYAAAKFAVQLVLPEHLSNSEDEDIVTFSMGGASMQFNCPSNNISVPLGINVGSLMVQERGVAEGGELWEEEAREVVRRSLQRKWI